MVTEKSSCKPAIGFLTVIDHPQHGLFGGYLILNFSARPLEFHCTAPIKPNRAQQILYGPTLEAFLYGEQIGSTLLGHAKTSPRFICTDRQPMLALRDLIETPVALILPPEGSPAETNSAPAADEPALRIDASHGHSPRLLTFELGRNRLAVSQQKSADRNELAERLGEAATGLDLWEPFTRIREAIEEAQQAAR